MCEFSLQYSHAVVHSARGTAKSHRPPAPLAAPHNFFSRALRALQSDARHLEALDAAARSSMALDAAASSSMSLDALPHELLLVIAARLVESSPTRGVPSARSLASLSCTCTTLRDTSFADVVAAAARTKWQTNGITTAEALFLLTTLARQRTRMLRIVQAVDPSSKTTVYRLQYGRARMGRKRSAD